VPNISGMRPVDRVAASLASWLGGGVQPANRSRVGMFCDAAPIWRFVEILGATQDPEEARVAAEGRYLMEVFPALAFASIAPESFGRLKGLHYNPGRKKTFRQDDWITVAKAATSEAQIQGFYEVAQGTLMRRPLISPGKPVRINWTLSSACLCLLVALRWRRRPREESLMLGDLKCGYMVLPASRDVRERLTLAARKLSVPVDGVLYQSAEGPTHRHRPLKVSTALKLMPGAPFSGQSVG